MHLQREVRESGDDRISCVGKVESELGTAVEGAAQRHRPWLDAASLGTEGGEQCDIRWHEGDLGSSGR